MALKTGNGAKTTPAQIYREFLRNAASLRDNAVTLKAKAQARTITLPEIEQRLYEPLIAILALVDLAKNTPGMNAYAKDQVGDSNYDLQAEITAFVAEVNNLRNWLEANFPNDATNGALHLYKFAVSGGLEPIHLAAGHAVLITRLDALIATVE